MGVNWWLDAPLERDMGSGSRRPRGTFEAKFNAGTCYACRRPILKRELCRFMRRGGVRVITHYGCPTR